MDRKFIHILYGKRDSFTFFFSFFSYFQFDAVIDSSWNFFYCWSFSVAKQHEADCFSIHLVPSSWLVDSFETTLFFQYSNTFSQWLFTSLTYLICWLIFESDKLVLWSSLLSSEWLFWMSAECLNFGTSTL